MIDLPGCCFMLSRLPLPSAGDVDFADETWDMWQPPIHVHGFCPGGKKHLARLWHIKYFRTMAHSASGGKSKPCIMPADGSNYIVLGPSLVAILRHPELLSTMPT